MSPSPADLLPLQLPLGPRRHASLFGGRTAGAAPSLPLLVPVPLASQPSVNGQHVPRARAGAGVKAGLPRQRPAGAAVLYCPADPHPLPEGNVLPAGREYLDVPE